MTFVAFVGTGFVADYYMTTLANHPELKLAGAFDRAPAQLDRFTAYWGVRAYASLAELLADPAVGIVVNLTTLESHHEVSKAALEAGKHVYSEKPLAASYEQAAELLAIATTKRLMLCGAPANAQTPLFGKVARLVEEGAIGTPRLVYAQMEDGAVFRENWRAWRSASGARWPGESEFAVGCTLEHAVYALAWMVEMLGPVDTVTAFSAVCFPDKDVAETGRLGPDFSVGMLNFRSGAVARLTTGLCAPKDRALAIMGDGGTITVDDLWNYASPARIERTGDATPLHRRIARYVERTLGVTYRGLARPGAGIVAPAAGKRVLPAFPSQIDFAAGIASLAAALKGGPAPFMSGETGLHVTELALAISSAGRMAAPYEMRSLRGRLAA